MKESTLHQKLENIVRAGKPRTIKVGEKSVYVSKKKIEECKKEGGILPLLTLIPLITGGAAGIAKAVLENQARDAKLVEVQRHNRVMMKGIEQLLRLLREAIESEGAAEGISVIAVIARAVLGNQVQDAQLTEDQRHQRDLEKVAGWLSSLIARYLPCDKD